MSMQQIDFVKLYKKKHCLVIDDYPDFRLSIKRMINTFGVEHVDLAGTGAEAVNACRGRNYDIILCDYNLGEGKSGQQILEELRFKGILKSSTLYVMITAEITRDQVLGALEYMPDAYITKPVTQSALKQRLDRLILEQEAMTQVHLALDLGDKAKATTLCEQMISGNERYRSLCNKLLAQLYFDQGRYDEARDIYESVQAERKLEWAELGIARVEIARGFFTEAEDRLKDIELANPRCMEVYDRLAELYSKQGRLRDAQSALERGVYQSPQAILRQKKLADVTEQVGEWDAAEKARRRVLKLSNHSVFEGADNYLALAGCMTNRMVDEGEPDSTRLAESLDLLRRAETKFKDERGIAVRAKSMAARALTANGEKNKAAEALQQAKDAYQRLGATDADAGLDLARALMDAGEKDAAHDILKDVASACTDDPAVLAAVDKISEFPMTETGKAEAVRLNRRGKELFDEQKFREAIQFFEEARTYYPNHIALNLNLLLAICKFFEASGIQKSFVDLGEKLLKKIGDLPEGHEHFARHARLSQQFRTLCRS